jgi:hypothetical protein
LSQADGFAEEVRKGTYPQQEHTYPMKAETFETFRREVEEAEKAAEAAMDKKDP